MSDESALPPGRAPEHRPNFWVDLGNEMRADAAGDETAVLAAVSTRNDSTPQNTTRHEVPATTDLPVVESLAPRRRSAWPLVAAAMTLAIVGLGFLFLRGDSTTAEVVSGTTTEPGADAAAGVGGDADPDGDVTGETSGEVSRDVASDAAAPPAELPTDELAAGSTAESALSGDVASDAGAPLAELPTDELAAGSTAESGLSGDVASDAGAPLAELPTYELAAGNDDTAVVLPRTPFPDGTRILATWEEPGLTWYGLSDPQLPCTDPRHGSVRVVNTSGGVVDLADPQPYFSGRLSNWTMSADETRFAWVAECDGQLELYVAEAAPIAGEVINVDLAWVGRGSDTAASMRWDGELLIFGSIADDGSPFSVEVDPVGRGVVAPDLPAGLSDARFDPWVVGATADGRSTWWNTGPFDQGTCDGLRLVLDSATEGQVDPFVDPLDAGGIVDFAIESETSQVAFADACPEFGTNRFFLGSLRADGRISSVREIDLSPFTAGHVVLLQWTDPITLRIHTDESATIGRDLRLEYRFDDGRDSGVLVVLG